MQSIVVARLGESRLADVDYGARFKQIRKERWKGTVLQLAKKLGTDYPTSIYNIERAWRVPQLRTIQKHATALGCDPWELLQDVDTEYDRARALATLPFQAAMLGWRKLLTRYEKTTERGSRLTRDGQPLAVPVQTHDELGAVSGASRPTSRHIATELLAIERESRAAGRVAKPPRAARIARQPTATPRAAAPGDGAPARKRRR